MSNMDDQNSHDSTYHQTEVANISEESRHGFQQKYSEDAKILDLDSSLDCQDESSCSTDAVQHTVQADLYGTDKDPAYDEEEHSYVHAVHTEAFSAGSSDDQHGTSTSTGTQFSEANVGTSTQAQFSEGDVRTSQAQFSEEYVGTGTQAQFCEGHVGTSTQAQFNKGNGWTSQEQTGCADEQGRLGESHPGIPTTVYQLSEDNRPTVDHNHNDLNPSTAESYPSHNGVAYNAGQTANCYQGDSSQFASSSYPEAEYAHQHQSTHIGAAPCNEGQVTPQTQTPLQPQQVRPFLSPESQIRHLMSPGTRHNLTPGQRELIDQLASELVHNYGGHNSHMISDILKATVTHEETTDNPGSGYSYEGFERPDHGHPASHYSTPQMIHDVLSTPSQLPAMEEELHHQHLKYGAPQSTSTPDLYRKGTPTSHRGHNSVTYNDIHVHGGKWTTGDGMYENEVNNGRLQETASESPFPYGVQPHVESDVQNLCQYYGASPHEWVGYQSPYVDQKALPGHGRAQMQAVQSHNAALMSPTRELQGEITKTTFTTREHMQLHLNSKMNYHYPRSGTKSTVSDIEFSSIYPPRDFIERTACSKSLSSPTNVMHHSAASNQIPRDAYHNNHQLTPEMSHHQEQAYKRYAKFSESSRPPKKRKQSKYSTEDLRVPPQMPLVEDTEEKYPPLCGRDEIQAPKLKYFVVNPSDVTNMAPKALMTKYIDFLIRENEQITEISKSVNPPVDVYVKEDMLFMETLRYKHPFPSKKFVEWVASFYPCLNFMDMKFKGRKPEIPPSDQPRIVPADPRPKQVILDDVFFFFQRERMKVAGRECNLSTSIHE